MNQAEHEDLIKSLKETLSGFPDHMVMGLSGNGEGLCAIHGGFPFMVLMLASAAHLNSDFKRAIQIVAKQDIVNQDLSQLGNELKEFLKKLIILKEKHEAVRNPKNDNSEIIRKFKESKNNN